MQSFNHSTIQPFNHSIIQSFNHSFYHSFNQATKQRYHVFITIFITFTKDRLKIPYFLLFPLALTLLFPLSLIRATTFLNHLIP
ncbi:hypothetical protein [Helicobacter pylori]|uniref:hypothetical protein n=1 Tax=Helicobacter pylori TaxID=210 RepID=UPI000EB361D7|nr:hypothetical protein DD756_08230 [Helicobacter pylori]